MAKFCDNCANPINDNSMPFCPKCGAKLATTSSVVQQPTTQQPAAQQPPYPTYIPPANNVKGNAIPPTHTSKSRAEIFAKAIPFFSTKDYAVRTQTDYLIAFESQKRDVSWVIFLVLCCLGILPAIIYYYWFTHLHQVTVSLSGTTDVTVTCIGNTAQAKNDAAEFMRGI